MIPLPFLKGVPVGVFGLGKAGLGALGALKASGAEIFAWDDTPHPARTTPYTEWPWETLRYLVLSPGVPFTHPTPHKVVKLAQQHRVPIVCDIELLTLSQPKARFVGITGTNGKSTTTALTHHILKQAGLPVQVGGNIGISALELEPLPEGGVYVIETSSYQLDLLQETRFDVAVLLNITPDHIDRHGDMAGYIAAKKRIFRHDPPHKIIGIDEPISAALAKEFKATPISSNDTLPVSELPYLPGAHNRQNVAAATAICHALGLADAAIAKGIASFTGLAHRMQRVGEKSGVTFINDSKATNAEAAEKALLSFGAPLLWIAGGKPKEGGITALAPHFHRITHAFLIGEAEAQFAETLQQHTLPFTRCGTLEKAVQEAYAMGRNMVGATVLLSPACASFDQFKSFEHRGEQFAQYVSEL